MNSEGLVIPIVLGFYDVDIGVNPSLRRRTGTPDRFTDLLRQRFRFIHAGLLLLLAVERGESAEKGEEALLRRRRRRDGEEGEAEVVGGGSVAKRGDCESDRPKGHLTF